METSYTTLESGEIETIRKAYRYTTAENREHYIDLIYHYTTAFGEWKKTYVKETHLIDGVWEDLYEEAYVYDEDGYETEAVQWLYENNVKYADITEKTKYDSNHNIIQSLYYAGQGTGADDWLLITQFDYEYDNNVRTRKYRYALTEDGEWLADWGEGTDWDLNVPVADLLVFIGYEDDYKIWATYQFEGNGGTGWNENKSTYYYSPLHPESINDTQKGIISVYPNPTTSILYINSEEDTKATVYNLQGMILKQITGKQIDYYPDA